MKKEKKVINDKPAYGRWVSVLAILIFIGFLIFRWTAKEETGSIAPKATTVAPAAGSESPKNKLEGKWQRTDGGYILDLSDAKSNGDITAGYFNPNPVNVGRALWQNNAGKLMLMVELQDRNYPGSIYNLEYVGSQNILKGTYFQAVEKMTYNVEFTPLN